MPVLSEPTTQPTLTPSCGSVEERLALVERVASSSAFSKSVRLRDFLRYVGRPAAGRDAPEIHEQEIGEKVFGRTRDYDRSQDNIVRVNATELRRRIDIYFATEGAGDPIVFSIPRGSYMPVFRLQSAVIETPKSQDLSPPNSEPVAIDAAMSSHRLRQTQLWIMSAALSALVILSGFLLWQNARLRKEAFVPERRASVDAFWSNMFDDQRDTDIVLPDDSISVEEEMTGKRVPLRDYADRDFLGHVDMGKLSSDRAADLRLVLSHNLVTLGGFYAALRIHDLRPHSPSLHMAWARFYSADSMKQDNVVFIGGAKANPWVGLYENQLNFNFDYNNPTHALFIQNRHPQAGEASSFFADSSSSELAGYAVVAYLPNPSNKGNVILLLGSDSDASNAAAEYLTSEESLKNLLQTLGSKTFPHFELLLQVSRVRGTSLTTKVVSYRVYP